MELKRLAGIVFAGYLGFVIFSSIYIFLFVVIIIGFSVVFAYPITDMSPLILYAVVPFFIYGAYYGIKSLREKNVYYEIFRPGRKRVYLSFILGAIGFAILYVFSGGSVIYNISSHPLISAILVPLLLVWQALSYYPFSSLVLYLYEKRSKTKKKKTVVSLIALMNPLSSVIIFAFWTMVYTALFMVPCGATFEGFMDDSAARDAGMSPGDTIVMIDGKEIKNALDMGEYLESLPPNQTIHVITSNGENYSVGLMYNETQGKNFMGIVTVTTEFCKK